MFYLGRIAIMPVLALLLLAACTTHLPERNDQPERTVAVTDIDVGLAGRLNRKLSDLGWRLIAYQAATTAGTAVKPPPDLAERARYRLVLQAAEVGVCQNLDTHYLYQISLINNRDQNVAMVLRGSGCEINIANEFEQRLRQLDLLPPPEQKQEPDAPATGAS